MSSPIMYTVVYLVLRIGATALYYSCNSGK
jgi:hypothetical protein